ncbi:flagellar basal body rod protein FlgB [Salinicola rhizosphaerae]|uniref:Flagellar basal body rod protein FlgB n=1 Tax=Salinicola rhizosphaerae TaxID=1443141 RepID=A0ABQ3DPL2_9GAMM|nr:flagellar basal body rod protein FlgB [Salinicola rhizosphaerae]GHB08538.1 flagellar basal body rod protein FlgB [Salinicola rhizosphaerae]
MFDKLDSALRFQQEAINLRAERQKVLANNIANADTPNFKARDFDFQSELTRVMEQGRSEGSGLALERTSSRHIAGGAGAVSAVHELQYRMPDQPSLDGNTVDMDRERSAFADNALRYQADLTFVSRRIQGLKNAMQSE